MRDLVKRVQDDFFPLRRASSLFDEIEEMFEDFGRGLGFSRFDDIRSASFIPAVDVIEKDGQIEIAIEVPGTKKDELSITVQDGLLVVSGEKKQQYKEEKDGYYRSEISYGSFHREFSLPENTKLEDVVANYEDGTLKITLPKPVEEKEESKKIEIK